MWQNGGGGGHGFALTDMIRPIRAIVRFCFSRYPKIRAQTIRTGIGSVWFFR
jgi:hypothetical protein